MKSIYKFISLFILAIGGCTPRLDVNPALDIPDNSALKTTQDLQNALEASYNALQNRHCLGGSFILWGDILADGVKLVNNDAPERNIYNWNLQPTDSLIQKNWEWAYKAIGRSNNLINKIEKEGSSFTDIDAKQNLERIKGEAYAIRGITYFYLALYYGKPYDASNFGSPTVPLKLSSTHVVENLPAAPLSQVYGQIVSDLETAIRVLTAAGFKRPLNNDATWPLSSGYRYFGNISADVAAGMLAKVYFQMNTPESLDKCLQLINSTIGLEDRSNYNADSLDKLVKERTFTPFPQPYVLKSVGKSDINEVFAWAGRDAGADDQNRPSYETIFQIMNNASNSDSYYLQSRFAYRPNNSLLNFEKPGFAMSNFFKDSLFRFLRGDLRRVGGEGAMTFDANGNTYLNKFAWDLSINFTVLRSAELLLMRSEIYALKGELSKAVYDLAFVKFRSKILSTQRILPNSRNFYTYSFLDSLKTFYTRTDPEAKTQFLREIEIERARELIAEGNRIHDLRRKKADIPAGNRQVPSLKWDDPKLVFPIPTNESLVNPNLK